MARDMFAGQHATVAMPDDDGRVKASIFQKTGREFVILDSFRDGLVGSAHGFAAVEGTDRVVAASIEREESVSERGYVGRKKARRANVEVHLIAVAIHCRALDGPIRRVVGAIQMMGWRRNANEFRVHEAPSWIQTNSSTGVDVENLLMAYGHQAVAVRTASAQNFGAAACG